MDVAIELKMTARQMERQSQKMEQAEKAEKKKILDVIILFFIKLGFEQRQPRERQDLCRNCDQKS
jgi:hypothetical protein